MTLAELLAQQGLRTALIVDDVFDGAPTVADIDPGGEEWANFNDDLNQEQRQAIIERYPAAASSPFDVCITDDDYIATIWELREELGDVATPLFDTYTQDQGADARYANQVKSHLEGVGITVETRGRDFLSAAAEVDLIVIDLFFGKSQIDASLEESKLSLRSALSHRRDNPPLVILMSRSHRLETKRNEFRDEVGLVDSGFRILKKDDLVTSRRLYLQLERLAENRVDSLALSRLFHELEVGLEKASERTIKLLRKLRLSDVGQIQQLLLDAEGQPAGSYLVDVFDRVLQHEIEREAGIIDAALGFNSFSAAKHPPPYVTGSVDLQELVQRILTQNEERLRLPGSLQANFAFGDLLRVPATADLEKVQRTILVDLKRDDILLVLTPACDIQRGAAPRILLLVGKIKELAAQEWSYRDNARTSAIRIDGQLHWAKWNLKHIETVSKAQIHEALDAGSIQISGRLREEHAIELQQRVLADLGRVGQMAQLPGTFRVGLQILYPDVEGKLHNLEIPELSDWAVCFVGRDAQGEQQLRLITTEVICDGVVTALAQLNENEVCEHSRRALSHVKESSDLRRMLTQGIDLRGVNETNWKEIPSETGAEVGVPKMGLIAWNLVIDEQPVERKKLVKAGVILLIQDANQPNIPGLDDAVRAGLVDAKADGE